MMKTMIKAGVLAMLLGGGLAQAADFKVGVVDTERVLRESAPAVNAEKKIEKEFSGRDQEIKKLITQAKDLQTLLEKQGASMSDAEHRNKERELTALNVDLQRMQREFREDLNLRKNEELAVVLELANKAIQAIADTEKFDLILQDPVVGVAARNVFAEGQAMLAKIIAEKWLVANAVIGLFPANSVGDDIEIYSDESRSRVAMRFHNLRQQAQKPTGKPNYCLADFVAPKNSGVKDYLGAFAATSGIGIDFLNYPASV